MKIVLVIGMVLANILIKVDRTTAQYQMNPIPNADKEAEDVPVSGLYDPYRGPIYDPLFYPMNRVQPVVREIATSSTAAPKPASMTPASVTPPASATPSSSVTPPSASSPASTPSASSAVSSSPASPASVCLTDATYSGVKSRTGPATPPSNLVKNVDRSEGVMAGNMSVATGAAMGGGPGGPMSMPMRPQQDGVGRQMNIHTGQQGGGRPMNIPLGGQQEGAGGQMGVGIGGDAVGGASPDQDNGQSGKTNIADPKTAALHQLVQHLYQAEAQVQLEATEIQRAQSVAATAQQTLEEATNNVRVISAALQNAQEAVAAAAMRAHTAQLQLAAHDQLLFTARQNVDSLSAQMVGLQAEVGISHHEPGVDLSSLLGRLRQPLSNGEIPSSIPPLVAMPNPNNPSNNNNNMMGGLVQRLIDESNAGATMLDNVQPVPIARRTPPLNEHAPIDNKLQSGRVRDQVMTDNNQFLFDPRFFFPTGRRKRREMSDSRQRKRSINDENSNTACLGAECSSEGGGGAGKSMSSNSKQKASSIAQKAAQEAKAASDAQAVAGQQASHQVKAQLAEKALQAAKAAEAALAGKQAIVEQLEQEVREAEAVVQEESASLQQAQGNVNAAIQAAQQATTQLKTLTGAVQTAQANVGNSEQAAQGAQQELAEKTQLMEAAKNRVEQLLRQLSSARADYASTKQAAYKASSAAHDAKLKTLTGAVQTAQANVGNSEQAAQGAQQQMAEKTQLMEASKNRVEQLLRQLSAARSDFANTKQAAYKASAAAHEAKVNAARNRRMNARNRRMNNAFV